MVQFVTHPKAACSLFVFFKTQILQIFFFFTFYMKLLFKIMEAHIIFKLWKNRALVWFTEWPTSQLCPQLFKLLLDYRTFLLHCNHLSKYNTKRKGKMSMSRNVRFGPLYQNPSPVGFFTFQTVLELKLVIDLSRPAGLSVLWSVLLTLVFLFGTRQLHSLKDTLLRTVSGSDFFPMV